ncbi:MAG: hypothetical protein PHF74_02170 [Dehalococcoidales bacterium]|nr:hypothetical protein [Dehalococcoidales bacterium]
MNAAGQAKSYLPKAALYFGIIGAVSLLFFNLIFQEDWTQRFTWLWFVVPLPVIFLIIAGKFRFIGGLLMVLLAISITFFDIFAFPGNPGQIAGRGIGYTIAFVSLPLLLSGLFYIIYHCKVIKISRKRDK